MYLSSEFLLSILDQAQCGWRQLYLSMRVELGIVGGRYKLLAYLRFDGEKSDAFETS